MLVKERKRAIALASAVRSAGDFLVNPLELFHPSVTNWRRITL
jgi:hypothetical protein